MTHTKFSGIEVQASEWLVAMNDRTVSAEERGRFESWLATDPEHERIYKAQESAWAAMPEMPHLLSAPRMGWRSARRVMILAPIAAAAGIIAVTVFLLHDRLPFLTKNREFITEVAQIKDMKLDDGSLVTLGAASSLKVVFTQTERRIVLTRGEAFFEVARDTARPFLVNAGDTVVRVLGTQFDVHYGPDAVRVSVLEGRVEVEKSEKPARVLTAGEATVASVGEASPVNQVNVQDLGAWRSGRLVYVDARLREVIADVNRYYDGKVELADERVGDLQLTTAFRADQIDRMIEVLTRALPIAARRMDERHIVLSMKNGR